MARIGKNVYFRQSTGKWEGRFVKGRKGNGRLWYGYVSGMTEAECTRKREIAAKIYEDERSQAGMGDRLLFTVVATKWLASESRTKKASTICRYRNNLQLHLNPRFQDKRFTEISREEVVDYIAELQAKDDGRSGMSPNTVKGILSVLRSVLAYGERQYHLSIANLARLPVSDSENTSLRVLTENEEGMLLKHIFSTLTGDGLGILLVLYTGLRLGELCSLRWEDIDFKERTVSVRTTMERIQTPEHPKNRTKVSITPPKSRKSIRTIPLHEDLLGLLRERAGERGTFFLTGRKDVYIEPRTMENRFKSIVKKAGIADVNFHALRHTFATRSIENGVDAKVLSEFLGHASVKLTLDRYVHPSDWQKRKNINALPGFREKMCRKAENSENKEFCEIRNYEKNPDSVIS